MKGTDNMSKDKVSLFGYNPTETPEEIIASDKDEKRKEAFKEAYKKVMQIIPSYFLEKKKKKNGGATSGGKGFTQNIIVTPENVKLETKGEKHQEEHQKEEDREREE